MKCVLYWIVIIKKDNLCGVIKGNKIIIPVENNRIVNSVSNKKIVVQKGKLYAVYNYQGEMITNWQDIEPD